MLSVGTKHLRREVLKISLVVQNPGDRGIKIRTKTLPIHDGGTAIDPVRLAIGRDLARMAGRTGHARESDALRPRGGKSDRQAIAGSRIWQIAVAAETVGKKRLSVGLFQEPGTTPAA